MALAFAARATVATSATLAANANRFMLPPWMWNPRELTDRHCRQLPLSPSRIGSGEHCSAARVPADLRVVTARKGRRRPLERVLSECERQAPSDALGLGRRAQRVDVRN